MESARKDSRAAFTLVELMCVVAVVAVLALVLLPAIVQAPDRSRRVNCINNLKQLGLGTKTWALDNEGKASSQLKKLAADGLVFEYFLAFTNELKSPRILFCPAESDPARQPGSSFTGLTNDNQVSYFVGLGGNEETPSMFLNGDHNLSTNGVPVGHGVHVFRTNDFVVWTQGGHQGQGNILMCDGSVQQIGSGRLTQVFTQTGSLTNSLSLP